jgi:hypothetical protein
MSGWAIGGSSRRREVERWEQEAEDRGILFSPFSTLYVKISSSNAREVENENYHSTD